MFTYLPISLSSGENMYSLKFNRQTLCFNLIFKKIKMNKNLVVKQSLYKGQKSIFF